MSADEPLVPHGLRRARTIVQLRRSLPLDPDARETIPEIDTRSFEVDRDAESLLAVNNAAFAWHPEQGGWDRARLDGALAQPWVDRSGILVHEREEPRTDDDDGNRAGGSALDGFCWTRVHTADEPDLRAAGDPALGEIWVIAVDPGHHRRGLGPALVAAGLDHLAGLGLGTAMLYTEEDNLPARRMYDRMGFTVSARRGGYR